MTVAGFDGRCCEQAKLVGSGLTEWVNTRGKGQPLTDMINEVIQLSAQGSIRSRATPFPFDELPQAFRALRERRVVGMAVLTTQNYANSAWGGQGGSKL